MAKPRKSVKRCYDDRGRRICAKRAVPPPAYFRVLTRVRDIPNHHEYGYEESWDFHKAINRLSERYGGLMGECLETRHAFFRLRIIDPQVWPPECAWIPKFMCIPVSAPPPADEDKDPLEGVFGDGW